MKVISAKNKNFDKLLDNLLSKRKNKLRSDYISVKNIIKDVRKNGDKALVKYEKKFNKNKTIIPNSKKIKDSNLPEDIRIGAIVRKDKVIIPRSNFIFEKNDVVVFLAKREELKAVESIFSLGTI